MIRSILAGIETEYGLYIDGRGASDQIEDSLRLVGGYPCKCFAGWDYRHESPRNDLRGFKVERLAIDPEDVKFDSPVKREVRDERSDRILPNGARFYNDHGHPEYSTPECWGLQSLVRQDAAGELAVLDAAHTLAEREGWHVRVYKNNTDYHGASYGTHESYLMPRRLGFEGLKDAVVPMLITRQILTGAGKVGDESGGKALFQLSQRADFFTETASVDTLFRRPVFNTRDEPHADPIKWLRLHVISCDANRIPTCTGLRVGLLKLALALAEQGCAPTWHIANPPDAFKAVSRDATGRYAISLSKGIWTTAQEVIESYLSAAEAELELDDDAKWTISMSRQLLASLAGDQEFAARHIDWLAKQRMLCQVLGSSDLRDPAAQAYDLEYHNVDDETSLYGALVAMGAVDAGPSEVDRRASLARHEEPTRARARGLAVSRFSDSLRTACWRSIVLEGKDGPTEVELLPDAVYDERIEAASNVEELIESLRGIHA